MITNRRLTQEGLQLVRGGIGQFEQAIVDAVIQKSLQAYGDRLRALVLTGSVARGEGTIAGRDGGWALLGDAEFFLVFRDNTKLPSDEELRDVARAAASALRELGLSVDIDLRAVQLAYFRSLKPHVFAYELRECGREVWGDGVLSLIPAFEAEEIPADDAFRLLANRMTELVGALAEAEMDTVELPEKVHYATVKLYLDMATSLLLCLEAYVPGYGARAVRIAELAERGKAGPFQAGVFAVRVRACTDWKLGDPMPQGMAGLDFLRRAVEDLRRLWRWELLRMGRSAEFTDERQGWNAWASRQPRIRGWLYAARRRGWHRGWRNWAHWARLALKGSPRVWVYGAAAELLFALPALPSQEGRPSPAVGGRLPIPTHATGWQNQGRTVYANYKEFLVGTRS